jgi:hypothetical protein
MHLNLRIQIAYINKSCNYLCSPIPRLFATPNILKMNTRFSNGHGLWHKAGLRGGNGQFESRPEHWLSWLKLSVVSLGPSKQISEQYLHYATNDSSHLLTIDRFISYPTLRRYIVWTLEATVTNPQRSSFGHAYCLVCLSYELSPTANCATRDLFLFSRSEKVL